MTTTANTNETDLTCPTCHGLGHVAGMSGVSGYGDPEEEFTVEECDCFAGTLRCGSCRKAEAVVLVDDGTAKPLPLCKDCKGEAGEDALPVAARVRADETAELQRAKEARATGLSALARLSDEAGEVVRAERARGAA